MINGTDDMDRQSAAERGQREYKTVLDAVRQKAAKQGRILSYHDAQQEAKRLYWQRKIEPDEAAPANDRLVTRLVEALADVLERSKAERIASAISDLVEASRQQKPALNPRKAEYPPTSSGALQLLDVKQLAELMGVSERTVWRISQEDPDFPNAVRVGRQIVRWRITEYNAWVEQQQADSGSTE